MKHNILSVLKTINWIKVYALIISIFFIILLFMLYISLLDNNYVFEYNYYIHNNIIVYNEFTSYKKDSSLFLKFLDPFMITNNKVMYVPSYFVKSNILNTNIDMTNFNYMDINSVNEETPYESPSSTIDLLNVQQKIISKYNKMFIGELEHVLKLLAN